MFLRMMFAMSLIGLMSTSATASPENVRRYREVDALCDSVMREYYSMSIEDQQTPAGQALDVLHLSLRAEASRQLLAMNDDEAISVFPPEAPTRQMSPTDRHQCFVHQRQFFLDLLYLAAKVTYAKR